jgi:hypothetical protein
MLDGKPLTLLLPQHANVQHVKHAISQECGRALDCIELYPQVSPQLATSDQDQDHPQLRNRQAIAELSMEDAGGVVSMHCVILTQRETTLDKPALEAALNAMAENDNASVGEIQWDRTFKLRVLQGKSYYTWPHS